MSYTKIDVIKMFNTHKNASDVVIYNEVITGFLLNMGFKPHYVSNTIKEKLTQNDLLCVIRYIKVLSIEYYINSILSSRDVKDAKVYSISKFLDKIKYSDINISTCGHYITTPTINEFLKNNYQLIGNSISNGAIYYSKQPLVLSHYYTFFINYFSDDVLYQENDIIDILEDIILCEV